MPIRRGHARVLFNEGAFAEDTMRSGRAGAKVLRETRNQLEREGVEIQTLRRCESESREGVNDVASAWRRVYGRIDSKPDRRRPHGNR